MSPVQPAIRDGADKGKSGSSDYGDEEQLCRDIQALEKRHAGEPNLPWNTYFDELIQRETSRQ